MTTAVTPLTNSGSRGGRYGIQPCKAMILGGVEPGFRTVGDALGIPLRVTTISDFAQPLSNLLGYRVPVVSLNSYVNGHRLAPMEIRLAVARLLGVPLDGAWTTEVANAVWTPRGSWGKAS